MEQSLCLIACLMAPDMFIPSQHFYSTKVKNLSVVEQLEGILKIANLLLSVVAGMIAISLFQVSRNQRFLRPWRFLIVALVLFAIQQILGAFRAFHVYSSPYLTHINPTFMLGFVIVALVFQIILNTYDLGKMPKQSKRSKKRRK